MTQVKICGVCDAEAARVAAAAGADLIGMHFCDSSRRITPEEGRAIASALGPERPRLVGVFINQDPAEVREVCDFVGLDLVQLHGAEEPGRDWGRPAMKVLKVRDGEVPDDSAWPDPILLDSWSPDHRGGTGQTWDWTRARELASRRKVFFAGGLSAANVAGVVRTYGPYGVDVSSGVESEPRVKDPVKVRAFVAAVRSAAG